jgi:hypothetical protein
LVSVIGPLRSQAKLWLSAALPSLAVTVTRYGPNADAPALTVPVIAPVPVLMCRPAGSPLT